MTPINFLKWSTFFTSNLQSWKFQHFFIFLRQILESKQNYKIRAAGVIELVDVKPRFAIFNIIITWSIKFTHLFPSVCLSHYNNVAEIISFLNTLVLNRSFSSCNVFSKMELNCFKMAPIWSLPSELELFADLFVVHGHCIVLYQWFSFKCWNNFFQNISLFVFCIFFVVKTEFFH